MILTTWRKDIVCAYSNQANGYLVEPVRFDRFKQLLNELGYYWLGWNHQMRT